MKRKLMAIVTVMAILCLSMLCVACVQHSHTFASEWTSDETNHWHVCTSEDCSEVSGLAAHVYNDGVCECGYVNHSYFQVSDEDWADLFKVSDNLTQTTVQTYADGSSYEMLGKMASNGISTLVVQKDAQGEVVFTYSSYMQFDTVNDKVYIFTGSDEMGWQKQERGSLTEYMSTAAFARGEMVNKSNYTYNPETKAYEAASITEGQEPNTATYTNISIKIEDGKLIALAMNGTEGGQAYTDITTYTYGEAVIVFPKINTVTSMEFNMAVGMMDVDVKCTTTYHGETGVMELDKDGKVHVVSPDDDFYYEVIQVEDSAPTVYKYTKTGDTYVKTLSSQTEFMGDIFPFMYTFNREDFTYENGKYVADSASIGTSTYVDVELVFEDAKLISVRATISGATVEAVYEYSDINLTLPTVE